MQKEIIRMGEIVGAKNVMMNIGGIERSIPVDGRNKNM
jgi:hypothetical protein